MKIPKLLIVIALVAAHAKAAESSSSPKALFEAARLQEQSEPAKAISLYKSSAEGGYLPAQFLLAGLYRYGIGGLEKSCKKAIYWYERAEEQGSDEAASDLAGIYADDASECFSQKKSVVLYKRAAESGIGEAQHDLALLYVEGRGVPKNSVVAYAWLSTSMHSGNYQRSLRVRDAIEGTLTARQIHEAKELAKSYVKKYGSK